MIFYSGLIALRAAYLQAIASGNASAIRATTAALGAAHKRAYGIPRAIAAGMKPYTY